MKLEYFYFVARESHPDCNSILFDKKKKKNKSAEEKQSLVRFFGLVRIRTLYRKRTAQLVKLPSALGVFKLFSQSIDTSVENHW